jgi:hypothetical protein
LGERLGEKQETSQQDGTADCQRGECHVICFY